MCCQSANLCNCLECPFIWRFNLRVKRTGLGDVTTIARKEVVLAKQNRGVACELCYCTFVVRE